ncbi:hypothetical protein BASA83_002338 [Batrachochytrium salamandrivorans]|nr:hypothetical protein BASA83_002338 [Batrachochytrium salamandrivorans]
MKLVSFAVVSFLAATVSAGLSETLGNVDDSVHRLEKRDPSEDMQKQLEEEIERSRQHYKEALRKYQTMKHFEVELEAKVSEVRFGLQSDSYKPRKGGSNDQQRNAAISSYRRQYEVVYGQYKLMMIAKKKFLGKVSELSMLTGNQQQLEDHNENHPDDLWTVTPPTSYNEPILSDQISAICRSMEEVYILKDELKATSKEIYDRLMTPEPDKKSLREQYTKVHEDLVKIKEDIWVNNMISDHCILCDQQLLSTSIAHLVVECEQVTGHRIQSGLVPAIQKSRLRLLGRALDPGVENVYTWLRGGVLNGEADLDQRWLDGTVEQESMGTRHDNRVLGSTVS